VVGVKDGKRLLAGRSSLDVRNVIWCTGYHHSFRDRPTDLWSGRTAAARTRVVKDVPGLYFVGRIFVFDDIGNADGSLAGAEYVVKALEFESASGSDGDCEQGKAQLEKALSLRSRFWRHHYGTRPSGRAACAINRQGAPVPCVSPQ